MHSNASQPYLAPVATLSALIDELRTVTVNLPFRAHRTSANAMTRGDWEILDVQLCAVEHIVEHARRTCARALVDLDDLCAGLPRTKAALAEYAGNLGVPPMPGVIHYSELKEDVMDELCRRQRAGLPIPKPEGM